MITPFNVTSILGHIKPTKLINSQAQYWLQPRNGHTNESEMEIEPD